MRNTRLSRLDLGGVGRVLLDREMKKKNIADLPQLMETAAELEIPITVCEMSMRLMGIRREELMPYPHLDFAGAGKLAENIAHANTTLFI